MYGFSAYYETMGVQRCQIAGPSFTYGAGGSSGWPEIPADVVSTAVAMHAKLSDPAQLAAYKAKLLADAQGDGRVIIHHSVAGSPPPFQAIAVYTVIQSTPQGDGGPLYFDANGNPVTLTW